MVVCGHAHENYGVYQMDDCSILNVALSFNKYDPKSVELANVPMMYPYGRKEKK
jgi:hypothetical protein